jgi:DNA-binding MarR family transcriptional regulator
MIYIMIFKGVVVHDVVKELGYLALGTRFKRIGESLQAQAQALLASNGMDMPAAHFPLLAALDRLGPLGVSELSQAVGVSQPVVSRSLLGLESNGLVESTPVAADRRMRCIRLSRKGRELVRHAKSAVWPVIEAAVAQTCKPLKGSLLDQLSALEAALAETPLLRRATATSSAPPLSLRGRSAR